MGAETGIHRPDNAHGPLQPRRRALDVGAWLEQSERITDMAAALDRSHKRSTELLTQCRDHDGRRATAHALAATLAAEVDRLNETIAKLAAEGQDAHEM